MLQNLVAPVILLAASVCTTSYCFLHWFVQLSHTVSLFLSWDRTYAVYSFSSACLLTSNFRVRNRFNLLHAALVMVLMWTDQVHGFEKIIPRCS